jgi:predicted ribosome quality control (RQC) complex YloA/Tae2 family protein
MPVKAKSSMTSFDLAAVVRELQALIGSRLSNIYAYMNGFLLKFKGNVEANLVLVPAERAHLTSYIPAEKGMPPPLVMGLRKYLRGSRLEEVVQHRFDRVAVFRFCGGEGCFRLVAELLPRGVIVLSDDEWRILFTSETREMKDRILRRGITYQFPPSSSVHPQELSEELLRRILGSSDREVVRVLARGLGYPGEVVEEALARLGVKIDEKSSRLVSEAGAIAETLRSIYLECLEARGYLVFSGETPITVTCFKPSGLSERYGFTYKVYDSVSRALDEYYAKRVGEGVAAGTDELEAERRKLEASLQAARENLERLRERLRELEAQAILMAEHMGELYEAYNCIMRVRDAAGWDMVVGTCPHVVDVEPSRGVVRLSINGRIVELDVRYSPDRALVELYKRIGEIKAKIERGERAVREAEDRIRRLEERIRARRARMAAVLRRREWYEKYHWIITSRGFLAIGGRDASQNESVVRKYLNERRIFMHADVHGAPAVVFFAEGQQPPEQDLREAAVVAAAYSKAWKAGIGSVDVYWVWGSQVSKSPPAGEYLARGAFMVYGRKNYIRNVEVKLALGVGIEDSSPVIVVGPDYLVRRRSTVYAILAPGDEDPSHLAKRLRKLFASRVEDDVRPLVEALTVDEIRERIPGRARVLYIGRGTAEERPRPLRVLHEKEGGEA